MSKRVKDDIERKLISARIDKELFRKVKIIAAREERETYTVIEDAVRQYVNKKYKEGDK